MKNLFLAGVATVDIYDGDQLFATAKTLIDSSISIDTGEQDVRGGEGNKLFGKYFHTSKFDAKLTDTMFRLEYLAKNTGSQITVGSNIFTEEEVVLAAGGTGTVVGTPVAFATYGTVGWATLVGDSSYQTVVFTGNSFTFIGGVLGQKVCVKFVSLDSSARQTIVSANIIPATVRLVMKVALFAGDSSSTATKAGFAQIEIPRFIFSGKQDIAMTSSGVSNTPLTGSALAVSNNDCSGSAYYAIISEQIFGANWYDDVTSLSVAGGEVDLAVAGTETLRVYALHTGALPSLVSNADLTFSSDVVGVATAGLHSGVILGVSAGSATVSVTITAKPSVEAFVGVVVV
jgi:hypothetical protein